MEDRFLEGFILLLIFFKQIYCVCFSAALAGKITFSNSYRDGELAD